VEQLAGDLSGFLALTCFKCASFTFPPELESRRRLDNSKLISSLMVCSMGGRGGCEDEAGGPRRAAETVPSRAYAVNPLAVGVRCQPISSWLCELASEAENPALCIQSVEAISASVQLWQLACPMPIARSLEEA